MLRFVILAVSVLFAPLSGAAEEYTYPPGADSPRLPSDLPWELPDPSKDWSYDRITVPDRAIEVAYLEFTGDWYTARRPDHTEAMNELRYIALSRRLDKVRENLEWSRKQGWDRDFLEMFRLAIEWGDKVWHADGSYAWELAQQEAKLIRHPSHQYVTAQLRHVALRKDYPPAIFAFGMEALNEPDPEKKDLGRYWVEDAAHLDYGPALQTAVDLFLDSPQFTRHVGVAYYWLIRAERRGLDMTPWRTRLERVLTERDRTWAEGFLTEGEYPKDWDYE